MLINKKMKKKMKKFQELGIEAGREYFLLTSKEKQEQTKIAKEICNAFNYEEDNDTLLRCFTEKIISACNIADEKIKDEVNFNIVSEPEFKKVFDGLENKTNIFNVEVSNFNFVIYY